MILHIRHQESYSRLELLLRSFFGWIYIVIPHLFLLYFISLAAFVLLFISWWAVLFTGKFPRSFFDFQVDLQRWSLRVVARIYNLSDGYPAFGMKVKDENTAFEVPYPEKLSRGLLLLRTFFGWLYVGIPHGIVLMFRMIAVLVLMFLAWWVVLFTGKYPKSWHTFNVDTLRWATRVNLYLYFMTDEYPPFSGKANLSESSNELLDDSIQGATDNQSDNNDADMDSNSAEEGNRPD